MKKLLFLILLIHYNSLLGQTVLSSNEAKKRIDLITKNFNIENPDIHAIGYRDAATRNLANKLSLVEYVNDKTFRCQFYLTSAYTLEVYGLPEESFKIRKKAEDYFEINSSELKRQASKSLLNEISFNYSQLALDYAERDSLLKAKETHLKNIDYIKGKDSLWYSSSLSAYAYFYKKYLKELDSALVLFQAAKRHMPKITSEYIFLGSIDRYIADIFYERNELETAQAMYLDNYKFYKKYCSPTSKQIDWPKLIATGTQYIKTSLMLEDPAAAASIIPELLYTVKHFQYKDQSSQATIDFYDELVNYHLYKNDYIKAYEFQKKKSAITDSISKAKLDESKRRLRIYNASIFEDYKSGVEKEALIKSNQIERQRLLIWLFLAVLLIISGISYFLIDQRKKRILLAKNALLIKEQESSIQKIKNDQLLREIDTRKKDLTNLALNITLNKEWVQELSKKLDEVRKSTGKKRTILLNELEDLINNKVRIEEDSLIFKEKLDNLSESFYNSLSQKFPGLTKTETRLCSLIRLRLETSEIALIQNISIASLNSSRYRLRKKLGLKHDENLDNFIQSL